MRAVLAALLLCLLCLPAAAEDGHAMFHAYYQNWLNADGQGCCNNQDCHPIADKDVREVPTLEVRVGGEWCPVLPRHYLRTGNAPDWSTAHVCVLSNASYQYKSPCERLLCFQPKPGG